ncbi:MAG: YbhB/YbcL family Raf kinase inhibitor-like protein [Candidatus Woesearchaeota archaeon]
MEELTITSDEFKDGDFIPDRFGCKGENVNPVLKIDDMPEKVQSMVLIMDDPDAPVGIFTHWIMWDIEPSSVINENSAPGVEGKNDFGKVGYGGPCPPAGAHRYFFRIYALDEKLGLVQGASREELEDAMKGKIVAEGQLMGKYSRN